MRTFIAYGIECELREHFLVKFPPIITEVPFRAKTLGVIVHDTVETMLEKMSEDFDKDFTPADITDLQVHATDGDYDEYYDAVLAEIFGAAKSNYPFDSDSACVFVTV